MMVKIRLTRMGAKKAPFYRIVAVDSRKARDGEYIEQIGYYNPVAQPKVVVIDSDVAKKWLANGAQPTETVRDLFKANGIL
ncbi:MAG: 30S ribosomal protein S16 [Clostridia bacterium]|nr:30S ribosomal protein S16 [Clostridia bacterium]